MTEKFKNTLHIYGQEIWHDDAFIVGDAEALTMLRDAITKALEGNKNEETSTSAMETFAADGEGYKIHVACVDNYDTLENIRLPYVGNSTLGRKEYGISDVGESPWKLIKKK